MMSTTSSSPTSVIAQRDERQPPFGHEHHDEAARQTAWRREMMVGRLLVRPCWSVETSFVMRLRMSPCAWKLKYFCGTRLIFSDSSRAHPVGHFERDARHDIVLDKAKQRAQAVDHGQQYADSCNGCKINAAESGRRT